MAPFSYARRAILWHHNMVPFNGAILWHVCTLYLALDFCHNVKICRPMYNMHPISALRRSVYLPKTATSERAYHIA